MTGAHSAKPWIAGGALLCAILAAVAWFMFVNPQLDERADTQQQTADVELQNTVLQQRIAALRADRERLGDLQQQLDAERAGLPAEHQMESFTEQLTAQAAAAGVTLDSITPAQPTLVAAPAAPPPAEASDPAATGAGEAIADAEAVSDAADDAAAAQADAASAEAPAGAQAGEPGPAGQIYSIGVIVTGSGTLAANRALLSAIEKQGPRRALVTSASLAPVSAESTTPPDLTETASSTETADSTEIAGSTGTAADDPSDTAEGGAAVAPPATAAADQLWTMTVQLQVFVAPQAPQAPTATQTPAHG